jgi:hypothetical protein
MNRRHWMKALWETLAFLVLAAVAFGIAVCPLSDANVGVQTPTASEKNPATEAGEGSNSNQGWDWEWQEDQDPSMVGRPIYLR